MNKSGACLCIIYYTRLFVRVCVTPASVDTGGALSGWKEKVNWKPENSSCFRKRAPYLPNVASNHYEAKEIWTKHVYFTKTLQIGGENHIYRWHETCTTSLQSRLQFIDIRFIPPMHSSFLL